MAKVGLALEEQERLLDALCKAQAQIANLTGMVDVLLDERKSLLKRIRELTIARAS